MPLRVVNKKSIVVNSIDADTSDFEYWKTQSYSKRLEALESIRKEYNTWRYGAKQRFQRVYRVTRSRNKQKGCWQASGFG